jgi:hypothetical protein
MQKTMLPVRARRREVADPREQAAARRREGRGARNTDWVAALRVCQVVPRLAQVAHRVSRVRARALRPEELVQRSELVRDREPVRGRERVQRREPVRERQAPEQARARARGPAAGEFGLRRKRREA